MKLATTSLLALAAICQNACGPVSVQPATHSGLVGQWRSADGSFNVEFSPRGSCSARMRLQGRDLGGPCTYTVDNNTITIHYQGVEGSNATATWHYTLDGDALNVSVMGNSLALQRVH